MTKIRTDWPEFFLLFFNLCPKAFWVDFLGDFSFIRAPIMRYNLITVFNTKNGE